MSEPGRLRADLVAEVLELCHGAPNLRQACRSLLELLIARLDVGAAVILTRHQGHIDGSSAGVSPAVLERLLALAGTTAGDSLFPPVADGAAQTDAEAMLPAELEAFESFPLQSPPFEFAGLVWIDTRSGDVDPALLRALLDDATPPLARLAELDGLRLELDRFRDETGHLRRAFDSLPDPVIVLGEASEVRLGNRRADELLISAPAESFGRRRAVETNNLFFSAFRARAILGDDDERELFLVDPSDGSDLLFEVKVLEVASPAGPGAGSIFILRDITDLKRATTELEAEYGRSVAAQHRSRRESERLNVILGNAGIPILVTDDHADIVLMNHEAERLFEAPAGPDAEISSNIRSNDAKITGLISEFLLQGERRREVGVSLRQPLLGESIPVRVVLTKIVNRRNEPIAVVCVIHDLTEEMEVQRLADELRRLNADLETRIEAATVELSKRNRELERQGAALVQASRLKSEFLAMMSHELRTPISSVLGFNTLLQEEIFGPLTSGQRGTLQKMRSASDHLLSLINDVLDLSQVEAGKLSVQLQDVMISPFIEELAETIHPMARKKGLEFELDLERKLSPVRADPVRLRQVVLNLASNAVKFTDHGKIVLRTRPVDTKARVRLEVEDTGVGIEQADLEEIFEEFRQGDRFATREHGGTGLGLAISRKLIDLMNGTLSVRSAPGEGSVFWLELPTADARPGNGRETREGTSKAAT